MSQNKILEDIKPLKLNFTNFPNLHVISTIGDGNCYFHSILRAFNPNYINASTIFDRINMARNFRNALADLLSEIDPITGKDYYSGLNNGKLEEISRGVKEYSKEELIKELKSSEPVDNIYQELISNCFNKDIYIIDGETKDMYNIGSAFSLYYKGRNSIVLYYTPGHFEVIGVKRSNGNIDTIFTPEHKFIQDCKDRLISSIRIDKKPNSPPPKSARSLISKSPSPQRVSFAEDTITHNRSSALSPVRVTALRAASPKR